MSFSLYDERGLYIKSDYQAINESNALIQFTPTKSGEYYLGIQDLFDKATGDYTIGLTGGAGDPLSNLLSEMGLI